MACLAKYRKCIAHLKIGAKYIYFLITEFEDETKVGHPVKCLVRLLHKFECQLYQPVPKKSSFQGNFDEKNIDKNYC